ncbi:MAG TPA: TetR/AcrR family transcriptional regulator [Mycobacteriales bacterium]|nr:TetR/AcrR family transcriptional regulator [Mycobacteriales bacterium]
MEMSGTRSRPADLTREKLVTAVLELIERDGISAVTMKQLACRIGCSTTAAYKHVLGKDELLELAADRMIAQQLLPARSGQHWTDQIRAIVQANLYLEDHHPWVSDVMLKRYENRGAETPNVRKGLDRTREVLVRGGFSPRCAALGNALVSATIIGLVVEAKYRSLRVSGDLPDAISEEEFRHCAIDTLVHGLQRLLTDNRKTAASERRAGRVTRG